jgi:hypothetical protein
MRKFLALSLAAVTALGAVAYSTQAAAYHDTYYGHDDDDNTETAIIAGVIGLAIGAALGSSYNKNRYGSYGSYGGSYGGYGSSPYGYGYGSSPYGGSYGGYGTSPYGYGSYGGYGTSPYGGSYGGYGYSPYGYNSYGYNTRCRTVSRWDPYTRRYVRYQAC